jgi:hypothetical protein
METDYTIAIVTVIGLVVILGGMTTYVLSRPTDLTPRP